MSYSVWRKTKRKVIRETPSQPVCPHQRVVRVSQMSIENSLSDASSRMVQASFYERGTRETSVKFYYRVVRGYWQTASQDAVIDVKDIMFHDREASIEDR